MEPLEEAGVAVPFRAINSVRNGCALHSRSRCCFPPWQAVLLVLRAASAT